MVNTMIPTNTTMKHPKRKVAMVIGYIGSNYYGLQMDIKQELKTIEGAIEEALYQAGFISASNHGDLTKVGWSRSSRTDKGVHAARIVLSLKVALHPSIISRLDNNEDKRIPEVVDRLSKFLPSDIKIFSCIKVNQGFMARSACSWREYEYLLPWEMMEHPLLPTMYPEAPQWSSLPASFEEAMTRLNAVFERMEGPQSFHNFHKIRRKELYKPKPTMKHLRENNSRFKHATQSEQVPQYEQVPQSQQVSQSAVVDDHTSQSADDDVELQEEIDEEESDNDEVEAISESEEDTHQSYPSEVYKEWTPVDRDRPMKVRGAMYIVRAEDVIDIDGRKFIRIVIKGQSFLLHQIRIMMACAVLIVRGVMPKNTVDMALLSPYFINLPTAPALGLCLVEAGFSRNSNKQDFAMSSSSADHITVPDGQKKVRVPIESLFMTDEEYALSQIHKQQYIYKRIASDWSTSTIYEWLSFVEKFRVSKNVEQEWERELDTIYGEIQAREEYVRIEESCRIARNIEKFVFQNFLHARKNSHLNDNNKSNKGNKSNKDGQKSEAKLRTFKHKSFLPNSMSTELIRRFRVNPGISLQNVLKALATEVAEGRLSPALSVEEIVSYVEKTGGMEHWKQKKRHFLIE